MNITSIKVFVCMHIENKYWNMYIYQINWHLRILTRYHHAIVEFLCQVSTNQLIRRSNSQTLYHCFANISFCTCLVYCQRRSVMGKTRNYYCVMYSWQTQWPSPGTRIAVWQTGRNYVAYVKSILTRSQKWIVQRRFEYMPRIKGRMATTFCEGQFDMRCPLFKIKKNIK